MRSRLTICFLFVCLCASSLTLGQETKAPQGNSSEKPAASAQPGAAAQQSGTGGAAKSPSATVAKPTAAAKHAPAPTKQPPRLRHRAVVVRQPRHPASRASQAASLQAQLLKQRQAEQARKESAMKAAAAKTKSSQEAAHTAASPSPAASNSPTVPSPVSAPAAPASASTAVQTGAAAPSAPNAAGVVAKSTPAPPASSGASASSSPTVHGNTTQTAAPVVVSPTKPVADTSSVTTSGGAAVTKPADPALSQTKPDLPGTAGASSLDHTLDSPLSAVGDSWKMIAYLLPTLLFIVVCLNLLRRYQQRKGQLPGFLQAAARKSGRASYLPPKAGGLWSALLGSFHLNNAREAGGSSIRLLESVPVGGVNLHLVQVRGRLLLLGASGGSVNVLTEFREQEGIETDDFRAMLHAAAADMDTMEFEGQELPVSAVVGSLDEVMRETGDSMQRRIRRLRTVQEAEDAVD